jgi:hypothetical protein
MSVSLVATLLRRSLFYVKVLYKNLHIGLINTREFGLGRQTSQRFPTY